MSDERIDQIERHELRRCCDREPGEIAEYDYQYRTIMWLIKELRDARAEVANLRNSQQIAAPSPRRYRELVAERDELREDIERIINALDEDWVDNADFEGWGDVEGMVRTVQTLCRRYAEERDRADAAERALADHPDLMARLKTETGLRIALVAAERQLAAVREALAECDSYNVFTAKAIRAALSSGGTE